MRWLFFFDPQSRRPSRSGARPRRSRRSGKTWPNRWKSTAFTDFARCSAKEFLAGPGDAGDGARNVSRPDRRSPQPVTPASGGREVPAGISSSLKACSRSIRDLLTKESATGPANASSSSTRWTTRFRKARLRDGEPERTLSRPAQRPEGSPGPCALMSRLRSIRESLAGFRDAFEEVNRRRRFRPAARLDRSPPHRRSPPRSSRISSSMAFPSSPAETTAPALSSRNDCRPRCGSRSRTRIEAIGPWPGPARAETPSARCGSAM